MGSDPYLSRLYFKMPLPNNKKYTVTQGGNPGSIRRPTFKISLFVECLAFVPNARLSNNGILFYPSISSGFRKVNTPKISSEQRSHSRVRYA